MLPNDNITAYEAARQQSQEILRRSVIEAAERLLVQCGPQALKVREIADELGCSTKVIYTMFGGKDGLANALYAEGIKLLREDMEQIIAKDNAAAYLNEIGWGYWNFAIKHPSYYRVMFGNAIPDFTPSDANLQLSDNAFEMVAQQIARFASEGSIVAENPLVAAKAFWTVMHGVVILHLDHYFDHEPGINTKILQFNLQMLVNELTNRKQS